MNELDNFNSDHTLKLIHDKKQFPDQPSQVTIPIEYNTPEHVVRSRCQGHMTWPRSSNWGLPVGEHEEKKKKLAEERRLDYMRHLEEKNKKFKEKSSKDKSKFLQDSSVQIERKQDSSTKHDKSLEKYHRDDAGDMPATDLINTSENPVDVVPGQRAWAQARLDYEALLARKRADESRYRFRDDDAYLSQALKSALSDKNLEQAVEGYEKFKRYENEARKLKAQQHVFADEEDWLIRYIEAKRHSEEERYKLLHWLKNELDPSSQHLARRISSARRSSPPMPPPPAPPPPGETAKYGATSSSTVVTNEGTTLLVGKVQKHNSGQILSPNTIRRRREEYRKELEKQIEEQLEKKKREKKFDEERKTRINRALSQSPKPDTGSVPNSYSADRGFYLHPRQEVGSSFVNYHTYPGRNVVVLENQEDHRHSVGYDVPSFHIKKSSNDGMYNKEINMASHGIASKGGGDSIDKKARSRAYQEELAQQMKDKQLQKQKEKEEQERYERRIEEAGKNYNPWGKSGAGAPIRDPHGNLITERKRMYRITSDITGGPHLASTIPQGTSFGQLNSPSEAITPIADVMVTSSPNVFGESLPTSTVTPMALPQLRKTKSSEDEFFTPTKTDSKSSQDYYKDELRKQIEEKKRRAEEAKERQRLEEEEELKRIEKERKKIQEEYEAEQKKIRTKEEEKQKKNDEIRRQQEEKKKDLERKRKEEEGFKLKQMQEQEREKLSQADKRSSPPVPAIMHASQTDKTPPSPPVPALKTKLSEQQISTTPVVTPKQNTPNATPEHKPSIFKDKQLQASPVSDDILTQLAAMKRQLQLEHERIRKNTEYILQVENNTQDYEMYNMINDPPVLSPYSLPRLKKKSENVDIINIVKSKKGVSVRRHPDSGSPYYNPTHLSIDTRVKEISGSEASLQGSSVLIRDSRHIPQDDSDAEAKSLLAETTFIPIENLDYLPDDFDELASQKVIDIQNGNVPPTSTLKRNHSAQERKKKQQEEVSSPT